MERKKRILFADDERDLVETLTYRLEAAGYEVIPVHGGREAIDEVRKEKPDLIILDVMMPGMDGYAVCRELKNDAEHKDIPIILFSARAQDDDKKIGIKAGADDYVIKPFDARELLAKIRSFLERGQK